MVVAIIISIIGLITMFKLPVALYPDIVPPEIVVQTNYLGGDAISIEKAVATPIEQMMSGVDDMNYMFSLNSNNGIMRLTVNFDVKTDPNIDLMLAYLREAQTQFQLPQAVQNYGINVYKSRSAPLIYFALYSPKGTYDAAFLANYAYIHLNDPLTQSYGIASVAVYGAGQYAMRCWVRPDVLAKLSITIPEIVAALQKQNTVNPAGQIGGEPIAPGQKFTYTIRTQGRLETPEEFGEIVLRANPDGSLVRLKDVARIELGVQDYSIQGRFNGKPAANIALLQLPGTNDLEAAKGAKKVMARLKEYFPPDLDYTVALDTTLPITEGIREIAKTFAIAIILVALVVFVFLQGLRATLIPIIVVPVSLLGTFIFFPFLGFSVNPVALMGMVVAIGLVVDDAIIVVEAVERHIGAGLSPKEAALKAMEEVSGPVMAIALILASVFFPTVFLPGITGRLYQQFAVTIGISVLLSAFNALTLSPALCVVLLRPKGQKHGLLSGFYSWFNRIFTRSSDAYVGISGFVIRKAVLGFMVLAVITAGMIFLGMKIPEGFLPEEDQGYMYAVIQLPDGASLQRTVEAGREAEKIIMNTPGVKSCIGVSGFSLLSYVHNTYSGFFFITLKPWSERRSPDLKASSLITRINRELNTLPQGEAFCFSPPAIQGVGTAGGVTFILEDLNDKGLPFLSENTKNFIAAARKRPELKHVSTTLLPNVPQYYVKVDRAKVQTRGLDIGEVYATLQAYMGELSVNYFNRFGRQWQVYLQAEGDYRKDIKLLDQFYVRNSFGNPVPLSAVTEIEPSTGPEFTMRYNLYRSSQINATAAPGYSSAQAMKAMEEVFTENMPHGMGYNYMGMSFQEKLAQKGIPPVAIYALSVLFVFLILAALYESWSLPFSVLLGTPIAVFGAFAALMTFGMSFNIYAQIGLTVIIGLSIKDAILIVSFAKKEYEKGKPLKDAALIGARLRLRPILMTTFAFILGCLPLALASGSGAIARQVMGTGVIGGMLAATCIAIFLIPMMFYIVWKISKGEKKA
jgi:HAE1 family hydrophobic/amphiphilic exporter-1